MATEIRSFITCIVHLILLGLLNRGGSDGQGM
jgi:hypothetical protein